MDGFRNIGREIGNSGRRARFLSVRLFFLFFLLFARGYVSLRNLRCLKVARSYVAVGGKCAVC